VSGGRGILRNIGRICVVICGIIVLGGCVQTAIVADAVMTQRIVQTEGYWERNPILGRHPSTESIVLYFGALLIVHTIAQKHVPEKYRKVWDIGWSAYYSTLAVKNYRRLQ